MAAPCSSRSVSLLPSFSKQGAALTSHVSVSGGHSFTSFTNFSALPRAAARQSVSEKYSREAFCIRAQKKEGAKKEFVKKEGARKRDGKKKDEACKERSAGTSAGRSEVRRRDLLKTALVSSLAAVTGMSGSGRQGEALADVWPSGSDYVSVATKTAAPVAVKYKETKNATPFTITYPDRFVEALNRKPGTEVSKDNGEETLVLIGDFKTFDTISVLRYPVAPGTPGSVGADEIAQKLIIGGNIGTEFLRKEMETPSDPSQGNKYHFEYVTEQCRGEVVEGLGGKRECFRGQNVMPTITRHHLVNVEAFKGFFYVVTASASQNRWAEAQPDFEQITSTFKLIEPALQPLEA